ncbi:MAG: Coenzyme F420 hydrogenase/dehydrogenase, beta subunit C-terminal domain [Candidatus Bathyarchaeota archaeon]|nr:Coenzyme F420 hydrogenase/dehydrogenase, beta subunit C-terminal domain [Candidatus Bathyarchaeota archaeon]
MGASKISFEASLAADVVQTGRCASCGACVAVCPYECLQLVKGHPRLVKECQSCGLCAQACPRYDYSQSQMENFVFGRSRKPDEPFGIYRQLAIAQATDEKILNASQDGGVATALLAYALKNGQINHAVVAGTGREKPFYPIPKLASTFAELLEAAGTKYTCSPSTLLLTDACKQRKAKAAFVGTPCQVQAVRKMQAAGLKRQTRCLDFLIGLMCSRCFTYEGLMKNHVHGKLGVDLSEIKKMSIKGKLLLTTTSGVIEIPLSEIKKYQQKNCDACGDFSSELADVSVGCLGLDKWTLTVIRTEKGEKLFSGAEQAGFLRTKPVNEVGAFNLLVRLSEKKRKNAATA